MTPVAFRSSSVAGCQPESAERLVGRRDPVQDEIADFAELLRLKHRLGVESTVAAVAARDDMGDLAGKVLDLELGDPPGSAPA